MVVDNGRWIGSLESTVCRSASPLSYASPTLTRPPSHPTPPLLSYYSGDVQGQELPCGHHRPGHPLPRHGARRRQRRLLHRGLAPHSTHACMHVLVGMTGIGVRPVHSCHVFAVARPSTDPSLWISDIFIHTRSRSTRRRTALKRLLRVVRAAVALFVRRPRGRGWGVCVRA